MVSRARVVWLAGLVLLASLVARAAAGEAGGLAAQGDTIPPDVAPAFNDGTTLTAITLEPRSGAVLLLDSGE